MFEIVQRRLNSSITDEGSRKRKRNNGDKSSTDEQSAAVKVPQVGPLGLEGMFDEMKAHLLALLQGPQSQTAAGSSSVSSMASGTSSSEHNPGNRGASVTPSVSNSESSQQRGPNGRLLPDPSSKRSQKRAQREQKQPVSLELLLGPMGIFLTSLLKRVLLMK